MEKRHHDSINSHGVSRHAHIGKRFRKTALLLIAVLALFWAITSVWYLSAL